MQSNAVQRQVRVDLANGKAGLIVGDKVRLNVENGVASAGEFPGQMLRALDAEIPADDSEDNPVSLAQWRIARNPGFACGEYKWLDAGDSSIADQIGDYRCGRYRLQLRPFAHQAAFEAHFLLW